MTANVIETPHVTLEDAAHLKSGCLPELHVAVPDAVVPDASVAASESPRPTLSIMRTAEQCRSIFQGWGPRLG